MIQHQSLLIVSDHQELAKFVIAHVQRLDIDRLSFSLSYTEKGGATDEFQNLGGDLIDLSDPDRVSLIIESYQLVISVHCKQIFPKRLVENVLCINLHPGYNPFNRGWYPQVFSIINDLPCGATLHRMTDKIDSGEIIAQERIEIRETDTSLDLYKKILQAEKQLIVENLEHIIRGSFSCRKPTTVGTFNSKRDYAGLCRLDLGDIDTLENHIRLLRALSHGQYKNGYIETADGRRHYLKIYFFDGPEQLTLD